MAPAPLLLLQERDAARRRQRLELYERTRRLLKEALAELIPGEKVVVFGSLTQSGVFRQPSSRTLRARQERCVSTRRSEKATETPMPRPFPLPLSSLSRMSPCVFTVMSGPSLLPVRDTARRSLRYSRANTSANLAVGIAPILAVRLPP